MQNVQVTVVCKVFSLPVYSLGERQLLNTPKRPRLCSK